MNLIEHSADWVVAWLEAVRLTGCVPDWLQLERELHGHLTAEGWLPAPSSCGCRDVVAIKIVLTTRGRETFLEFEMVKRPLRQYLH